MRKSKQKTVTKKKALKEVREEVLKQARILASGAISTAYPLVTATKEMMELEKSTGWEPVNPSDF